MSAIFFDGDPVFDAKTLREECLRIGLPTNSWDGKANSFTLPRGAAYGHGWILLSQKKLSSLRTGLSPGLGGGTSFDRPVHTLVFVSDFEPPIVFANLVIVKARTVFPGAPGDQSAVYIVEIADARYLAANKFFAQMVDRQMNVREPDGGSNTYYYETTVAGIPWTWQQIADFLWGQVGVVELGVSPQLPDVDGIPENFKFVGVPAWQAYNDLLLRIGCVFIPGYNGGINSVVIIGDIQPELFSTQSANQGLLIDDADVYESFISRVPSKVTVNFHFYAKHYGAEPTTSSVNQSGVIQWSTQPIYSKTLQDTQSTVISGGADPAYVSGVSSYPGSEKILWDDLAAVVDFNGVIQNQADLDSRAQERVDDYYRRVLLSGRQVVQTYSNFLLGISSSAEVIATGAVTSASGSQVVIGNLGIQINPGMVLQITGGSGAGQALPIVSYDPATGTATVAGVFNPEPDGTSTFSIIAGQGLPGFYPGPRLSAVNWCSYGYLDPVAGGAMSGDRTILIHRPDMLEEFAIDLPAPYEDDAVLNLRPPDIARHTNPIYPPQVQVILLNTGISSPDGVLGDATVLRYNPDTGSFLNAEPAWAVDVGSAKRLGKLTGQSQDRPTYLYQGNTELFAKILAFEFDTDSYAWRQQDPIVNGGWKDTPGGLSGTTRQNPAYEKNLNPNVPMLTIVDLELGFLDPQNPPGQDYRFPWCCLGGELPPGSGSGGTGGGPGTILTPCCPAGLSNVLHITFNHGIAGTVLGPSPACFHVQDQTVPLAWDGFSWSALVFWHSDGAGNPVPTFVTPAPTYAPTPTAENPIITVVVVSCVGMSDTATCAQATCAGIDLCSGPGIPTTDVGPGFVQFSVMVHSFILGGTGCSGTGVSCDPLGSCDPLLLHFSGNMFMVGVSVAGPPRAILCSAYPCAQLMA